MKLFLLFIIFLLNICNVQAKTEDPTSVAYPVSAYGNYNGTILPIKVDATGAVATSGGGGGSNPGAVTNLSCSDNLNTKIISASPGDTLILGSCTYSVSSAMTTITKSIKIKGQGKRKTIIDAGSNVISVLFPSTSDGLQVSSLTVLGTRLGVVFEVDLTGGTSSNGINNVFNGIEIDASNTSTATTGIRLYDTGATILNSEIYVGGNDWGASGQSYGIQNDTFSTMDTDSYLKVRNVRIENISTDTVGNVNSIIRGIRFYNFLNGDDPNNKYLIVDNTTIKVRDDATPHNALEALHMQGARITAYIFNTSLDGYGSSTTNTQNKLKDYRCDDGAVCHFANSAFVGGFFQTSAGTVYRDGYLEGQGIIFDQGNQDGPTTNGVAATAFISGTGATGGNANGTTSNPGGAGAAISLTAGTGGSSIASTTTGTGGTGGAITHTAGTGGNQTTSTATTNIGGTGGGYTITGGTGGIGISAATTNTGGGGGAISITSGSGATGTTTGGSGGNLTLATGTAATGTTTGGTGGSITITASAGVATNGSGGNVTINPGGASGSGTAGSIRMATAVAAFVGIGTTSPLGKLHVTTANNNDTAILERTTASTNAAIISGRLNASSSADVIDGFGPTMRFDISDSGVAESGIGEIGALRAGNDTSGDIVIRPYTTGTPNERMRIMAGGNVGIGTTIPSVSLDVTAGAIKTSNTFTSTRTTDLGWSIVSGTNIACNTTCISACVLGFDTAVAATPVVCTDATADTCLCAGPN